MKLLLFFALSLFFLGTPLTAQDADNLDCAKKKQLILQSHEVSQWQQALLNYQKSRIIRLLPTKKSSLAHDALEIYDYEWKTQRWQQYRDQSVGNDIVVNSDSIISSLNSKGNALKKKFDLLKTLSCKQSLFAEINRPVFDSLKVIRHQFYKERQN